MVAHPQSLARVPRTHQSGILPRPHYGVHKVRSTFAHPSLDLRSSFARPSLILRSRRQPPFDTIWACFPVSSDGIIKQKHNTKTLPYMRSVVMSGDRTSYSRRGRLRTRTGETAPPFSKHPFDIRLQRHDGLDAGECNMSVSGGG